VRRSEWRTFYSPESSNIVSVSYVDALKVLQVTFNNATTYEYQGVAISIYEALRDADSVGHSFNQLVKTRYPFTKLEKEMKT
jgi:hypothetical protein